jgi:hypothetical protein
MTNYNIMEFIICRQNFSPYLSPIWAMKIKNQTYLGHENQKPKTFNMKKSKIGSNIARNYEIKMNNFTQDNRKG